METDQSILITEERVIKQGDGNYRQILEQRDESLMIVEENIEKLESPKNKRVMTESLSEEKRDMGNAGHESVLDAAEEPPTKKKTMSNSTTGENSFQTSLKVSPTKIVTKHDLINSPSKKTQAIKYFKSLTTQEDVTDGEDDDDDEHDDAMDASGDEYDGDSAAGSKKLGSKYESFDPSIPQDIIDEMQDLLDSFPNLKFRYQLLDKIGEGTFSSVYKARDRQASLNGSRNSLTNHFWSNSVSNTSKKTKTYVALKRIYVTSSPQRIYNELKLLYTLSKSPRIAPLYDAMRYQDQIIAVLPYYSHEDFRIFYRILPIKGIKKYMFELFKAIAYIHDRGVIHRDIKPTNFLYNTKLGKGVLVDFGLAELQDDSNHSLNEGSIDKCVCVNYRKEHATGRNPGNQTNTSTMNVPKTASSSSSISGTTPTTTTTSTNAGNVNDLTRGYPKHETRRSRRANRAGTRGFRAPEVLLKCPRQTVKIDIWSCGVILLCLLARRFPMFQSLDDVESLMELSVIFGISQLNKCCKLHGLGCNISTNQLQGITEEGFQNGLKGYIKKLLQDEVTTGTLASYSPAFDTLKYLDGTLIPSEETTRKLSDNENDNNEDEKLLQYKETVYEDHKYAFDILYKCMNWNYHKRSSAKEILENKWFDELRDANDV